jgi:hypothetical protein
MRAQIFFINNWFFFDFLNASYMIEFDFPLVMVFAFGYARCVLGYALVECIGVAQVRVGMQTRQTRFHH